MGLAFRIIPMVLTHGGQSMFKGRRFNANRSVGVARQAVQIHQSRNVDELILLDVTASKEHRGPNLATVDDLTTHCFMPLTVGGGVSTLDHVRNLLLAGADKVAIGTAALTNLDDMAPICLAVGSQAMVAIINHTEEFVASGEHLTQNAGVPELAKRMEEAGFGEILLNCRDRDGMMSGFDLQTLEDVCSVVDVPVIVAGGCSSYSDMVEAKIAGASGVAVGAFFLFTEATPKGAAQFLQEHGVEVRL